MGKNGTWAIGILGITGTAFLAILMVPVLLVLVIFTAISSVGTGILPICAPDSTTGPGVIQATPAADSNSIPRNYYDLYRRAGTKWNVPWNVLAGIGWRETKHGTWPENGEGVDYGENDWGAGGPMQFKQSTFDSVKEEGMSRYDPADAIFSAAKLLKAHIVGFGASDRELMNKTLSADEIRRSLYSYNHADWYVNEVLATANRYAKGHTLTAANYTSAGCTALAGLGIGGETLGQRIRNHAAYYARPGKGTPRLKEHKKSATPYSWGGGGIAGPGSKGPGPSFGICCSPSGRSGERIWGFDCSGLTQYAVYMASGKKISLPRTAADQWSSGMGVKVSRNQLAPGDLVFNRDLSHVGIYWGEFNGRRWIVEAAGWSPVRFSLLDDFGNFLGGLRIKSPDTIRAMAPSGAGAGEGAT
jgi:hypothetical protein